MGIFDKLFGKTESTDTAVYEDLTVYAPVEGTAIKLEDFPDKIFAGGAMGQGCGIDPQQEILYAPFDGEISTLSDTLHAVGITGKNGIELLIHIGVDTVDMDGKGFLSKVKNGENVKKGDELIHFSRDAIKEAGHPDTIAVIVINSDDYASVDMREISSVHAGEILLTLTK